MSGDCDDVSEIQELFAEFSSEIEFILKGRDDPVGLSSIERRIFVRSVFSCIEAVAFRMKAWALTWETNRLSPAEIMFAKEEGHDLDANGTIKMRPARLPFVGNFRFAFAVVAKAAEVNYKLDVVTDDGWRALNDALKVRDRLMHPKRAADLRVSDAEVRDAKTAYEWVLDQMTKLSATVLLKHLDAKRPPNEPKRK